MDEEVSSTVPYEGCTERCRETVKDLRKKLTKAEEHWKIVKKLVREEIEAWMKHTKEEDVKMKALKKENDALREMMGKRMEKRARSAEP